MTFLEMVNTKISRFILNNKTSKHTESMYDYLQDFTFGGKRLRAKLCFTGAECIGPIPENLFELISDIAVAIELFHAAALVHDDLIDKSDSRRGLPAVHKRFAKFHEENSFVKCKENFGTASAILAGDMLLVWSSRFFYSALNNLLNTTAKQASDFHLDTMNILWHEMQNEVVIGQYMDVLHEHRWRQLSVQEALDISKEIMIKKSGKYSVQVPLCLGANTNGATIEHLEVLKRFSLPIGLAFQMRNDIDGAFANDKITGKPSSDLSSAKHTMLIGLARIHSTKYGRIRLEEILGQADNEEEIRAIVTESGALREAENLIKKWTDQAMEIIKEARLHSMGKEKLIKIASWLSQAT
ncbi:polyprenyl synthetase family protein [Tropheryma whipplei]|uniref:polyprenyl synthetase family protein n=1 Tax=Tropheryma whipplei TaxID=2039 RepID=UPI0005A93B09|nr:polyprenyl synthetase family protein [Tropheryma whipplei]